MSSGNPILVTGGVGGAVVEALRSSRTRQLNSNPRAVGRCSATRFMCKGEQYDHCSHVQIGLAT